MMVNVARAREKVGSQVVQQSGIQCFNCKELVHFAKECRKPKRVKDSAYHKEKMLLCKQAEQADAHVPSQQELHLLFGPLYNEFFNADADVPSQQELDLLFGPLYDEFFNAENNNDQAEDGEQLQDNDFTNPFCASTQEEAGSSSHNIEQVRGNPSRPVETRRQLAIDPEMCMYALTMSTAEPKNIKEAMANSAWIEAMQEELHQFDRL
nr:Gag-Pol polyprotein [Tanacetum cinerariifolium]